MSQPDNTTPDEPKRPLVFICYAREDLDQVRTLFEQLRAAGADPWFDMHSLALGDIWEPEIEKAIEKANVFVPCLSPHFDKEGYRQVEVRLAMKLAQRKPPGKGGFIVPYILEPCELPSWCADFNAGDLSKPTPIDDLLSAIEKHCGIELVPPDPIDQRVRILATSLSSPDNEDRFQAAHNLGGIGPAAQAAVPALIEALKDKHTRLSAALALGNIGPGASTAVSAIIEAIKGMRYSTHDVIAANLARIGKGAVPALIEVLKDNESSVHRVAVKALGRIGLNAKAAIPALEALRDDLPEEVDEALQKITGVSDNGE